MRANPRECTHVFTYDETTHIVYCPNCLWYWDADFETPTQAHTRLLNADNEPTSEHMQWSEDNDA